MYEVGLILGRQESITISTFIVYWEIGSRPLDEDSANLTKTQLKLLHLARFTTSRLTLVPIKDVMA